VENIFIRKSWISEKSAGQDLRKRRFPQKSTISEELSEARFDEKKISSEIFDCDKSAVYDERKK
jgi:hypothetical protein